MCVCVWERFNRSSSNCYWGVRALLQSWTTVFCFLLSMFENTQTSEAASCFVRSAAVGFRSGVWLSGQDLRRLLTAFYFVWLFVPIVLVWSSLNVSVLEGKLDLTLSSILQASLWVKTHIPQRQSCSGGTNHLSGRVKPQWLEPHPSVVIILVLSESNTLCSRRAFLNLRAHFAVTWCADGVTRDL